MSGNTYELKVRSVGYGVASEAVQNIMQNLLDACDGAVVAASELVPLSQLMTAMVEHEAVMTVTASRFAGSCYRFRIHYEADGARIPMTDVVAEDMGYDSCTSMFGDVLDSLTQGRMAAMVGVGVLGSKRDADGGEAGTDGAQE